MDGALGLTPEGAMRDAVKQRQAALRAAVELGRSGGIDLPETAPSDGDAAWVKMQRLSAPRQKSEGIVALSTAGCEGLAVKDFEGLVNLEEIDLSRCSWVDQASLRELPRCGKLRTLIACQCPRLNDAALDGLSQEDGGPWQGFALRSMDLTGCPVTVQVLSDFGKKCPGVKVTVRAAPTGSRG